MSVVLVAYVVTRWRHSRGPAWSRRRPHVAEHGGRVWALHQRKGDRTPAEARMPPRWTPTAPDWTALGR